MTEILVKMIELMRRGGLMLVFEQDGGKNGQHRIGHQSCQKDRNAGAHVCMVSTSQRTRLKGKIYLIIGLNDIQKGQGDT
jgi:hypothetical protein